MASDHLFAYALWLALDVRTMICGAFLMSGLCLLAGLAMRDIGLAAGSAGLFASGSAMAVVHICGRPLTRGEFLRGGQEEDEDGPRGPMDDGGDSDDAQEDGDEVRPAAVV